MGNKYMWISVYYKRCFETCKSTIMRIVPPLNSLFFLYVQIHQKALCDLFLLVPESLKLPISVLDRDV